jgi:hypothetical protein
LVENFKNFLKEIKAYFLTIKKMKRKIMIMIFGKPENVYLKKDYLV